MVLIRIFIVEFCYNSATISACWSIEWSVKSRQENYTGANLRWTNEFGIDQIPERRSNLKTSVGFSPSVEDLVPSLALERIDVEFWHPEPSNFLVLTTV